MAVTLFALIFVGLESMRVFRCPSRRYVDGPRFSLCPPIFAVDVISKVSGCIRTTRPKSLQASGPCFFIARS